VDNSAQNIAGGWNFPWILTSSLLRLIFRHFSNMLFYIGLFWDIWQIPDFHEGIATIV
jgi:hypothetical protein